MASFAYVHILGQHWFCVTVVEAQVAGNISRAVTRFMVSSNCFPWRRFIHTHFSFPLRPYLEEPRNVIVHKGAEPLGISIVSGENGGIFVSKVTGGSIAHQAGLEYGDQLLEVRATECWCVPNGLLMLALSSDLNGVVLSQIAHCHFALRRNED